MDQYPVAPPLPATYYRRKAAEARQAAEEVTTRAIKARLHDLARDLDRLADAADGAAQTADAPAGVISEATIERPTKRLPAGADNHSARLDGQAPPDEGDSKTAAQRSERRRHEILDRWVPAG